MATVRIDYCGMEGEGANLTKAKQDAARKIQAALEGSYAPEILVWRGNALLIYREPTGWYTRLIADADTGVREGSVWGTRCGSHQEAIDAAQSHLAQCGWQAEDGDTPPPFLTDRRAVSDFRSWVNFQLRYQRAAAAGCSDYEAPALAV